MRFSLLWGVRRHKLQLITDFPGQTIGPVFNGKAVQGEQIMFRLMNYRFAFYNLKRYAFIYQHYYVTNLWTLNLMNS
jgi:hypothetical protein